MGGFRLEFLGQFQVRFAVAEFLHFAVRPEQTEICDNDKFRVHKWLGKSAVGKVSLGLVLARPFRNPQARHLTSSFRQDLDGEASAKEPPRGHFFPFRNHLPAAHGGQLVRFQPPPSHKTSRRLADLSSHD